MSKGSRFSKRVTIDLKYQGIDIDSLLGNNLEYLDMRVRVKEYWCEVRFTEFREVLLEILEDMGLESPISQEYERLPLKDKRLAVSEAIDYCMESANILVNCSCPDFRYRFSYKATKDKYNFGFSEDRPPERTNPNLKGSACKHLIGILNAPSKWKASLVRDVLKCIDWDPSVLD
jgi:hypothetical protein